MFIKRLKFRVRINLTIGGELRMRKMFMMVGMMLVGLIGCSKQGITLESIQNNGVLLVGLSADYPPFESHKMIDGVDSLIGFDVMLAEAIANELGVEIEFKEMDFSGLVGALQSSQVDMVISGMSPDEERQKQVDFSDLYYTGENSVLVRSENVATITSEEDLKGLKIGTQLGSVQSPIAYELTDSVKELGTTQAVVLELSNGNIDAVIVGKEIANRYAEQFDNVEVSNVEVSSEETMAVAVPKGSEELVHKVNEIISTLKSQGKLDLMLEEAIRLSNE